MAACTCTTCVQVGPGYCWNTLPNPQGQQISPGTYVFTWPTAQNITVPQPATPVAASSAESPDFLRGFSAGVKACKQKLAEAKYDAEKYGQMWSVRDVKVEGE